MIKNLKQDLKLLILISIILYFILLVLKQVNVVVIVIMLMIDTQKYVFLIAVKDLNVKVLKKELMKKGISNCMKRVNVNAD